MTAYSPTSYTGDGSTTDFTVSWPYLDADHVECYLDGVETSLFSIPTVGTIRFNTAPSASVAISIKRNTPIDPIAVWNDGAVILGADLNTAFNQSLYLSEEAEARASESIAQDSSSTWWEAQNKEIRDVLDPTLAQSAATKAYVDANNSSTEAAAAAASAAAASTSETNAAASAAAALVSENNAAADEASVTAQLATISPYVVHEIGGLEADVSGYDGLVRISGGATSAVPNASQVEMEAGTEAALRGMSPERVKQAIDKLAVTQDTNGRVSANIGFTKGSVSSSSNAITLNFSGTNYLKTTLTENITSITVSGDADGDVLYWLVEQAAGGYTVSGFPADWDWSNDAAYVATTTSGYKDLVVLVRDGSTYQAFFIPNFGTA